LESTVTATRDELVDRCKRGEAMAFKELYLRYVKAMYNTCLRILNNASEAEDVLQESFSEAFRNIHSFEYRSGFGSWIKQICINRSINQLKKRKVTWVDIELATHSEIVHVVEPDEHDIQFRVEKVKQAIQQLPDGYRAVLSLYLLEGYDHEEIAEILQVSGSTSRTQYIRAKQKLLQLLK